MALSLGHSSKFGNNRFDKESQCACFLLNTLKAALEELRKLRLLLVCK